MVEVSEHVITDLAAEVVAQHRRQVDVHQPSVADDTDDRRLAEAESLPELLLDSTRGTWELGERERAAASDRDLAVSRRLGLVHAGAGPEGQDVPTPATIESGQTPVVIDWDYTNAAQTDKLKGKLDWKVVVPAEAQIGGYYNQAISKDAPHPAAARLWQEFLYSDQGQLLWLKGYSHPALFADLVARKKVSKALLNALPSAAAYAKVRFASVSQVTAARAAITTEWPKKVGA
mgnify:CR=1 FL=1